MNDKELATFMFVFLFAISACSIFIIGRHRERIEALEKQVEQLTKK